MSNNDGADFARTMAMGEEIARLMVEVEALRKENEWLKHMMKADEIERLRNALQEYTCDCERGWCQGIRGEVCGGPARAALGEGKE